MRKLLFIPRKLLGGITFCMRKLLFRVGNYFWKLLFTDLCYNTDNLLRINLFPSLASCSIHLNIMTSNLKILYATMTPHGHVL